MCKKTLDFDCLQNGRLQSASKAFSNANHLEMTRTYFAESISNRILAVTQLMKNESKFHTKLHILILTKRPLINT